MNFLPEINLSYKTREDIIKEKITDSSTAAEMFRKMFNSDTIEYLEESILLLLNRANKTIGFVKLSQGGTASCIMDVKMIFSIALKAGASAILLSHNHPSGQLFPSELDKIMTNKIKQAGELLDITLLDHIIITTEDYYSFSDKSLL